MVRYHVLLAGFCLISMSLELGTAQNNARLLVPVGAVLDEGTLLGKMCRASIFMAVKDFYAVHGNYTTRLVIHARDSGGDAAGAAWVGAYAHPSLLFSPSGDSSTGQSWQTTEHG